MHDPAANAKRVQFYGLDGQDYANFPRILSVVSKSAPKALDLFYKKIAATPEVSGFFTSKTVMDHARDKQLDHWSQLFSRELGAGYFEKAEQIGNVHARIGLAPTWYIGGYAMVLEQVIHAVGCAPPRRSRPRCGTMPV